MTPPLARRAFGEFLGTGLLVAIVVGSGIAAQRLTTDVGQQLFENAAVTAAGLAVLIAVLGPVSGAHFNPVVSLADWVLGRRRGNGISSRDLIGYVVAQTAGAIAGALLANAMFDVHTGLSTRHRANGHLLLGEVVATAGLLLVILSLARTGKSAQTPWAVGAYIGAAYWFTSSTSFANPAVTVGREFSDTFAGIAPKSVPGFVVAQLVGAAVGLGLVWILYPSIEAAADRVVVPTGVDPGTTAEVAR